MNINYETDSIQKNIQHQENHDLENKNGVVIRSVSYIILRTMELLNTQLSQFKGKMDVTVIPLGNALSQHENFIKNCLSNLKVHVEINEDSIGKIDTITPNISLKIFKKSCKTSLEKILDIATNKMGIKITSHTFQINDLDIKDKMLNKKLYKHKALNFDCVRYAFYKLGEPKLENWIFEKTDKNPFADRKIVEFLTNELDYFIVNEPRENDLIIYLDELQIPIHFGVFSDPNKIYSKWGLLPQIFSHSVYSTPYGNSFIVLRKK